MHDLLTVLPVPPLLGRVCRGSFNASLSKGLAAPAIHLLPMPAASDGAGLLEVQQ